MISANDSAGKCRTGLANSAHPPTCTGLPRCVCLRIAHGASLASNGSSSAAARSRPRTLPASRSLPREQDLRRPLCPRARHVRDRRPRRLADGSTRSTRAPLNRVPAESVPAGPAVRDAEHAAALEDDGVARDHAPRALRRISEHDPGEQQDAGADEHPRPWPRRRQISPDERQPLSTPTASDGGTERADSAHDRGDHAGGVKAERVRRDRPRLGRSHISGRPAATRSYFDFSFVRSSSLRAFVVAFAANVPAGAVPPRALTSSHSVSADLPPAPRHGVEQRVQRGIPRGSPA